jgi:N-acetylmuramoyl-L-alanine amidase
MIARFARNREERMRRVIFRGLYEDNLSLLGRTSPRVYVRKRLPRAAKLALFAATLAIGVLFTGSSLSPVFFPVQQIQARFVAPAPPTTAPVQTPGLDPSLFKGGRGLPLSQAFDLGVKTILLDPGHGGEDTGAIGRGGTREKDIALDIARRLKRRLEAQTSAEVLLTRDTDLTLPLVERVAIAHAKHADLFVSIHLNFVPNKPINIIETFYFGPGTDAASLELARRENSGQGPGMSELREIIERMETQLRREESPRLAAAIQSSLYRNSRRENSGVLDYGIKRGPFVVLNQAEVPAVLAEVSCLSNREEEERLGTPGHREDIAAYLETGILDYLRNGETMHESKK